MPRLSPSAARPLLLAVVLLATSTVATAQAPRRPISVGLGGGATVPVGDFADDVKTGWHGYGFLQYEPDRNIWGVRGEVQYHRSAYTDDFLSDVGAIASDDLHNGTTYVGGSALLIGTRRDRGVTPYLIGGLGLYRVTVSLKDDSNITVSQSENGFGFNGGAGLRLGRTSGVFIEARFHQFSITPDDGSKSTYQMIPVSVGIVF